MAQVIPPGTDIEYSEYRLGAVTRFHGAYQGYYTGAVGDNNNRYPIASQWKNLFQILNLPGQRTQRVVTEEGDILTYPAGNGAYHILITYLRPRIILNPFYFGSRALQQTTQAFTNLEFVTALQLNESQIKDAVLDLMEVDPDSPVNPIPVDPTPDDPNPNEDEGIQLFKAIAVPACPQAFYVPLSTDRIFTIGETSPITLLDPSREDVMTNGGSRNAYRLHAATPRSTFEKGVKGHLQDLISPIERFKKMVLSPQDYLCFKCVPPVVYGLTDATPSDADAYNYFGILIDIEGYYGVSLEDLLPYFQLSP